MWKNAVEPGRPRNKMKEGACILDNWGYRHTLIICNTYCFSAATMVNLQAPCVLYIGQAFRYSPEKAFYVFNQQIYFIIWYLLDRALFIFHYIFLNLAKQSQFIPLQNVVYFITLPVLVRKIFTFYINDVLLFKCPFPRQQWLNDCSSMLRYTYIAGLVSKVLCWEQAEVHPLKVQLNVGTVCHGC